ncbi:LCP family glycopolymer transferase [Janibacter hoylei]|uniref:LCP family glycopolymer transferase n=1 Tax=Janibacter hoylei TaxID=364298 RepID=UPI0027BAE475|nr:LCP family protein [Janibacter hoylei]
MPDRPTSPRRPDDGRDDDAMTFDIRKGRRGRDEARAIPTGKRDRPRRPASGERAAASSATGGSGAARRPRDPSGAARPMPTRPAATGPRTTPPRRTTDEPRTRVMPAGTPPSRPDPEQAATPRRPAPPRDGGPRRPGGPGGPDARPRQGAPKPRRRNPLRTFGAFVLVLLLLWGGSMAWAVNSAWSEVGRVDATPEGDRPSSEGRNVLLVGSDARDGMTPEERNRLGTGHDTGGARTDSILVLHTGGGESTLLSIPRDSYVEIPGNGMNKINASFSIGGAKLLAQTIEHNTGLKIDGYMEIGFGGFATVVDAVGGVNICVKNDMNDEKAHINLKKGCQVLDGKNALGYVRARYSDPEGDLGRAKRQREFLGALMGKIATPSTMLQPWKVHSLGTETAGALTVGEDDSLLGTARAMWAFRSIAKGDGNSVTVPVANNNLPTSVGSAVQWDEAQSTKLFEDLRADRPITVEPGDG